MSWNDIFTAGPEVGLAIYGMILLMVGAFGGDRMQRPMMAVTTAVLTALALWQLTALTGGIAAQQAFGGMCMTMISRLMKALICLGLLRELRCCSALGSSNAPTCINSNTP